MNVNISNSKNVMRRFKFELTDINKYIVLKFRYEQHMFTNNSMFGSTLVINKHELSSRNTDYLYGVYKIEWHSEYFKMHNDMSYKVQLTPVGFWKDYCPNRSWYTSDVEQIINEDYDLLNEIPIFDIYKDAENFAVKKNDELYPYIPTKFEKFKSYIKGLFKKEV